MKVHLLFSDRDYRKDAELLFDRENLSADLELERIIEEAADGDNIVRKVFRTMLLSPLTDTSAIRYRAAALSDAEKNPEVLAELYGICIEAEERRKNSHSLLRTDLLMSTYIGSVTLLRIYTEQLMKLRKVADSFAERFESEAFSNLFSLIKKELPDDYFKEVQENLEELRSNDGYLISAKFGPDLHGVHYVLRRQEKNLNFQRKWLLAPRYYIEERDDTAVRDYTNRKERAINEMANALAQAAEHLHGFFDLLYHELSFFVGSLRLQAKLTSFGMPVCIPEIKEKTSDGRSYDQLYDVSLALLTKRSVTANSDSAEGKNLHIVTGANQGGKSTFLRSIGQAQLMAQAGTFIGAANASFPVRSAVFTHFKKEEDGTLKSGKLDEELLRMDRIADHIRAHALVLMNESFAATNEREGSEICRQITKALIENHTEVYSVTHLYLYAVAFSKDPGTEYLRAERAEDGKRTFRIVPGMPSETAHGEDLYRDIFGEEV